MPVDAGKPGIAPGNEDGRRVASEEVMIGRTMVGQLAAVEHQFIDMIAIVSRVPLPAKLIEDIAHGGGIRATEIEDATILRAKRSPEQSALAGGHVGRSKVLVQAGVLSSALRLRTEGVGSKLLTRIGPPTQPWQTNASSIKVPGSRAPMRTTCS